MELYKKLLLAVTLITQTATFTWDGEHRDHAWGHVSDIVHGDHSDSRYRDRRAYDRDYSRSRATHYNS